MSYQSAVASAFVIGLVGITSACGGTKTTNDAQAWAMRPYISGHSLSFGDGSVVNVHVIDASGRHCYAVASVNGVDFTTSEPTPGKPDPSTVDLTVSIEGQESCSMAGP